jgi:UDP-glucose 4-epimerase
MLMKIIVTGSSGQVGSYLVEYFSKEHEVIGLDNRPCPFPVAARFSKKIDIAKTRDLSAYFKDADWIIHTAAQVSVERSLKDPIFDAENNVIGTVNVLWNTFMSEARNFLYVSSAAVYGNPVKVPLPEDHPTNPMSPYGASKLCGEKYTLAFATAYGLSATIVRPFNIYSSRADPSSPYSGVITKFVKWAKEGKPLLIEGDGKQTRDFVHIADVVSLIDLILKKSKASVGRTFNCGTGKRSTILELAEAIRIISGREAQIKHVDPRVGDIRHSCADIASAEEILGYSPKIPLSKGLKELMA